MIRANISDEMEISNTYITEPDEIACTFSSNVVVTHNPPFNISEIEKK